MSRIRPIDVISLSEAYVVVNFCFVSSCCDLRLGVDQLAAAGNCWSADVAKDIKASHVGGACRNRYFQTVGKIRSDK